MADNRIILKVGDDQIVVAKCHGSTWRAGFDDLGEFLTTHAFSDGELVVGFEHGNNFLPEKISLDLDA